MSTKKQSQLVVENAEPFHATTDWLMAGVLAIAAPIAAWYLARPPLVLDPNSADFNPLILIPLVLTAFGLYFLVKALRSTMRHRRFGVSTLELESRSVALGATLRGRLRVSAPFSPDGPYRFRLRNIEAVPQRDSGSSTRYRDRVRAESAVHVAPDTTDDDGTIPFEIEVPTDGLLAGDRQAKGVVRWVLDVTAPVRGVDYEAWFGIDVRKS